MASMGKRIKAGSLAGVLLASLVLVSQALAASHHPKGEFSQFGECPLSRQTITDCVYSVSNAGSFTIGKKTVQIANPVTLQGGFEGAGEELSFYGAENGETLSKTPQPVSTGLSGVTAPTWWPESLQEWLGEQASEGSIAVEATLKLAAPATSIKLNTENLLLESGTALRLPVKIKLDSAVLGSNCYIGSEEEPTEMNLTTGASGSLKGTSGKLKLHHEFVLTTFSGGKLVNGTFAASAASGCGGIFSIFVDPLVDSILGLPSPSGENTAVLEGKLQDASASAVRESE
jgi:hypothetical protein